MRKLLTLFAVLLLCHNLTYAQVRLTTGRVTDQQGSPVPFVTVRIKGTKTGTSADADGSFSIKTKPGDVLVITGAGFSSKEVEVGTSTTLSVQVSRKESNLTEVVVTALGVQRQSKELGYATAKVNAEELNQAKVTNIGTGLAAKVSGLQVNLVNNGVKPDVRITLRGNRSILGNNQALLVVDDIQLPISYLSTINPVDVANVSVLKGASASALYGSAASNGVLIITTKRGRGKPQVTLSSTVNIESVAYTPNFQSSFGQSGGEVPPSPGLVHIGDNPYIWYVPYENQNYGPRFNGQKVPIGSPIRIYKPDGSFTIAQDSITYSGQPNAKKGFFNHGLETQNMISYSAGDDKSRFYMSFQDVNKSGIVPKDQSRRDAVRINGTREGGIFRIDYSLGYTLTHFNTTPGTSVPFNWGTTPYFGSYTGLGGGYFQSRPLYWQIINQPADVNLRDYRNWQTDPFSTPDGYYNAYYGNPWWQIDQTRFDEKSNDILGVLALTLKPTSWLDLSYRAALARDDYSNKYTQAGYTFAPWAIADTLKTGNIPSGVVKMAPNEGEAMSFNQRITSDFLASVHKEAGKFEGKFIAGTSLIDNTMKLFSASANALVISDFYNISNRLGTPTLTEYREETRLLGVFGDLTIGYNKFLYLHGSLRNDWNSLLSKQNRSYLYPAIDAAFIFTDAISGLQNSKVLSFGKFRAAHSKTAQVSINPYSLQNTFNAGIGFPFTGLSAGNVPGYTVNGAYANANIKPEISTDDELGLDLGFFNNRINLSTAVYITKTKNQTIPITISAGTGYTTAYVNSGVMQNKGIEIDLKFTPVLKTESGFKWDLGFNYAYNKNTVESLGYGLSDIAIPTLLPNINAVTYSTDAVIGLPYAQAKTSDWKRDPQGRIIVNGQTGLPTLDNAQHLFGTTVPPTKVGITTSISYKGFTLNAVADGRFGAVIFNGIGNPLDFTGVSAYSASSGRQPFVIPNSVIDQGNGKYVTNTSVTTNFPNSNQANFWAGVWNSAGGNYVNSADFWKLRELSLSYTIPKSVLAHLRIVSGATVGVTARNLITKRAKDNVWSDPEFSNTNGNATGNTDLNQLPPTKLIGFNLSVTF